MAKLRGAKKAAFLRRMARGRTKARRFATRRRVPSSMPRTRRFVRRRRGVYGAAVKRAMRRRRNPLSALLVNPSWVPALYGGDSAARRKKRRRRTTKGASSMAKRKRRSGKRRSRRAAPRKRVYRRRRHASPRRRRSHARRAGSGIARVRRGTRLIYINPRRRKGRRRHARRRNPGFGGLLRRAFVPYAAGIITAGAAAMLDTGLAKWPVARQLVKVGGVLAVASFLGRKYPQASAAAIGAIGASQGYPLITSLAGGLVARTPAEAVKGLGDMTRVYPEMGALLQGGLGALLQGGPSNVEDVTVQYETALRNMAGDDDGE